MDARFDLPEATVDASFITEVAPMLTFFARFAGVRAAAPGAARFLGGMIVRAGREMSLIRRLVLGKVCSITGYHGKNVEESEENMKLEGNQFKARARFKDRQVEIKVQSPIRQRAST